MHKVFPTEGSWDSRHTLHYLTSVEYTWVGFGTVTALQWHDLLLMYVVLDVCFTLLCFLPRLAAWLAGGLLVGGVKGWVNGELGDQKRIVLYYLLI